MGNWRFLVVTLCLPAMSCSFLFDSVSEGAGGIDASPPLVDCEGVQRIYDRGTPVDEANRFQYLDYAQGSITFWARAIKPVEAEVELVDVGGIRIAANIDGSIEATVPAYGGNKTLASDPGDVDWANDGDVFIALRWDSKKPVSGNQGGNFHVMLRVGQKRDGSVMNAFDVDSRNATKIKVGDTGGVFKVDQLVVYGRPLFVDNMIGGPDELREMSREKTDSAQLVRGGVDVSFATSSPLHSGCENFEALAWSMPIDSEVPGQLRSYSVGVAGITWLGTEPEFVPDDELIFSGGVAVQIFDKASSFDLELEPSGSYSVYALAHGEGPATPRLRIFLMDGPVSGDDILDVYAPNSSVEEAANLFATFQMPDDLRFVRVELSNANGASSDRAIFHTLVIRENFFTNASFETLAGDGMSLEGWDMRGDGGQDDSVTANSGRYSACFLGQGVSSDVTQYFSQSKFTAEEFYAAGGVFYKGGLADAITPGVNTGNSSFWGTGAPHEDMKNERAASPSNEDWRATGLVAYHLHGEESGSNEYIYLGGLGGQPSDVLDLCVDDAYFYPVTKIVGEFGP